MKTYSISWHENGVSKSFTLQACDADEAKQIAWSRVDADDIYVEEIER